MREVQEESNFERSMTQDVDEEIEVHTICARQAGGKQVRRLITSSRASSLLDSNEEDDDDLVDQEPSLTNITSEDDDTRSIQSAKSQGEASWNGNTIVLNSGESRTGNTLDTMVFGLSEDVSNYLCSTSVGSQDYTDAIKVEQNQVKQTIRWEGHSRDDSDTESCQRMITSGHCGWTTLCGSKKNGHFGRESTHLSATFEKDSTSSGAHCSDLTFLDFRKLIKSETSHFLGSQLSLKTDWMSIIRIWSTSSRCCVPQTRPPSNDHKRSIKNRCFNRTAQTGRMQQLWYQWHSRTLCTSTETPRRAAGLSPKNTSIKSSASWMNLDITKSQDDASMCRESITQPQSIADLYYDSDPEVFRHSKVRSVYQTTDRLPSPIDTKASYGKPEEGFLPPAPMNGKGRRASNFNGFSYSMSGDNDTPAHFEYVDLGDENAVKESLKDFILGKVTLVWHRSNSDEKDGKEYDQGVIKSKSPTLVEGWLEMGSRLQSKVVHPKFMWRELYQPALIHRRLSKSCRTPESIDLLSIVRILKPEGFNREEYPFAKTNCSFSIFTHSNERHVFEASSPEVRDWFAYGLKLVVARLASMIIVGDTQMFVEFFSPWDHLTLVDSELDNVSNEDFESGIDRPVHDLGFPLQSTRTDPRCAEIIRNP